LQENLPAVLRLEVEADRALVAVEREEERRGGRGLGAGVLGRRPAHVVPHARVLDLEHLRPQVGEEQRAESAGQEAREVEDLEAGERAHAAARAGTPRSERASSTV